MKTLHAILIGGVCGAVLSVVGYSQFVSTDMPKAETAEKAVKPLYWVAPMDPNFRKGQPPVTALENYSKFKIILKHRHPRARIQQV